MSVQNLNALCKDVEGEQGTDAGVIRHVHIPPNRRVTIGRRLNAGPFTSGRVSVAVVTAFVFHSSGREAYLVSSLWLLGWTSNRPAGVPQDTRQRNPRLPAAIRAPRGGHFGCVVCVQ